MNISEEIGRCELFIGLPQDALDRIATLAFERSVAKAEVLFAQDEPGTAFYLLISGAMKLYRAEDGREVIIRMVRAGEMFGEAVLFGPERYPVYAEAARSSRVIGVPRSPLLRLLDDHDFRDEFIAALIGRLRYLVDHIHVLSLPRLEDRFFRFLELRYGRKPQYEPALSRKDVAATLGVTPEAFSRLLGRLEQAGYAVWEGSRIRVSAAAWEAEA
jgi:CRP/FNR family transcriptional regulator